MSAKFSQPYQPLLLRILHSLIGSFTITVIITAYWTYDVYDGRWGSIPLPKFMEIEIGVKVFDKYGRSLVTN